MAKLGDWLNGEMDMSYNNWYSALIGHTVAA